jgi:hypothetical protein
MTKSECVRSSPRGGGWSNLRSLLAQDRWSSFTRKNSGFEKNKRPTSVVESYKTTYGHKVVVLMSVVEEVQTRLMTSIGLSQSGNMIPSER